jgi:hypothetical protein
MIKSARLIENILDIGIHIGECDEASFYSVIYYLEK